MSNKQPKQQSNQASPQSVADHVLLFFDGFTLTLTSGIEKLCYAAVSGTRNLYHAIPEGFYTIRAQDLICQWMRPFAPVRLSLVNSGHWNEKTQATPQIWGQQRITLYPHDVADCKGAQGLFIFGGHEGSTSCINLPGMFPEFMVDLKVAVAKNNQCDIILKVAYRKPEPIHDEPPAPVAKPVLPPFDLHPEQKLNLHQLKGHVPEAVIRQIAASAEELGLTTNLRLAHFLAQCAHESGGFKFIEEGLNYSAEGLKKIFSKYFLKKDKLAKDYARKPHKIASHVYASRMDNGDEASGDGYKYRGRGYIQLTGKVNYKEFAEFIGDDKVLADPHLVATKYPLASAAFFFNKKRLWNLCDKGSSDADILAVTKKVNGGTNGLKDRMQKFKLFYQLLQDVEKKL